MPNGLAPASESVEPSLFLIEAGLLDLNPCAQSAEIRA